ncbi:MAG: FHA domain-containing protein, partial [Candidatus Geothermarchaeales archaeon]
ERGGDFWVVDSNSVNGTFIHREDGFRRISRTKLRRGDLIALCHRPGKGPYVTLRADIP